jgi:hypothetical protein
MLYKFKSRATADVIMFDSTARQLLKIIGKSPDDQHGIITVAQIPAAIQALQDAVAADKAAHAAAGKDAGESAPQRDDPEAVWLHQRATPFIDMLRTCAAEKSDVIW